MQYACTYVSIQYRTAHPKDTYLKQQNISKLVSFLIIIFSYAQSSTICYSSVFHRCTDIFSHRTHSFTSKKSVKTHQVLSINTNVYPHFTFVDTHYKNIFTDDWWTLSSDKKYKRNSVPKHLPFKVQFRLVYNICLAYVTPLHGKWCT